jgi:hypothetical protein
MSVTTYQSRRRNISNDLKLLQQRSENFKSHIKPFDLQTNDNFNWKETSKYTCINLVCFAKDAVLSLIKEKTRN